MGYNTRTEHSLNIISVINLGAWPVLVLNTSVRIGLRTICLCHLFFLLEQLRNIKNEKRRESGNYS